MCNKETIGNKFPILKMCIGRIEQLTSKYLQTIILHTLVMMLL
jgi:hypothetical protein